MNLFFFSKLGTLPHQILYNQNRHLCSPPQPTSIYPVSVVYKNSTAGVSSGDNFCDAGDHGARENTHIGPQKLVWHSFIQKLVFYIDLFSSH